MFNQMLYNKSGITVKWIIKCVGQRLWEIEP